MGLALDEPKKAELHTYNEIDVLIDQQTKRYLQPSIIDCVATGLNKSGLIIRPQYAGC